MYGMHASKMRGKLSRGAGHPQPPKDSVSFVMPFYPSQQSRLLDQHQTIREIISSLNDARIYAVIRAGKWTIHDQIAHLASYQPIFMMRIKNMLHDTDPRFERYVADVDPFFEHCRQESTPTLLEKIDKDRYAINQLLAALHPAGLQRTGMHPVYGRMNLIEWTEFFLLHEAHHLFAVFQLAHGA